MRVLEALAQENKEDFRVNRDSMRSFSSASALNEELNKISQALQPAEGTNRAGNDDFAALESFPSAAVTEHR